LTVAVPPSHLFAKAPSFSVHVENINNQVESPKKRPRNVISALTNRGLQQTQKTGRIGGASSPQSSKLYPKIRNLSDKSDKENERTAGVPFKARTGTVLQTTNVRSSGTPIAQRLRARDSFGRTKRPTLLRF